MCAGAPRLSRLGLWGCSRVSGPAVVLLQQRGLEVSHQLAAMHGVLYSI